MNEPYCSNCKQHHPEKEFRDKLNRLMKTCNHCRTVKKPPVGKRDDSPVRPPESVLKLNRLWIAKGDA